MMIKKRILDSHFLSQIRKKGVHATEMEVTQFFDETGWRFYDSESMMRNFVNWRKTKKPLKTITNF
jgi:hypothetical protein